MRKIQAQGLHHVTIIGADRKTSIDFWEGVLGMPFIFDQPNLDNPDEGHIYFDPGDGRLITVFTSEKRKAKKNQPVQDAGNMHHLAFTVSSATFAQAAERLDEHSIPHSGPKDRGFMDSIYFKDPLGMLIELASYRFEPPLWFTHSDVLIEAHKIRISRKEHHIDQIHVADAIENLTQSRQKSLSRDLKTKSPC